MKLSTLETVFHSLNEAGARYLVAGGVAVNIHGYQRMTVMIRRYRQKISPDTTIKIVNIPTLIEMKKIAGRARDLDDIQHLQLISEEQDGQ